ncbi:MAG: NADP-dependent malic enzyme [Candidatus Curtissbacteria bacterium]|nr:NADP-dependent malic enzyme [Candidatus Curtissbacteria bacterium]
MAQDKKKISREAIDAHLALGGKIEIKSKAPVKSRSDLNIFYTPGVGAVSAYLAKHRGKTRDFTIKNNTVAIVSDGSAVLGLGNIGAEGAIPVMEGKAMIYKEFAGVNAFPIVLATQDVEEIIKTVKNISPVFGGIQLEDISAPRCFEIESRLVELLDIPVMHDDQHGTAIAVLAALINAISVVGKNLAKVKIVIIGAGAAGSGIARLLVAYGIGNILVCDSKGLISNRRDDLDANKVDLARITNPGNLIGGLEEAVLGADVLIGVSTGGKITGEMIASMATKPVVFAMANPDPEILPNEAIASGAYIAASGRSDFENQINNLLVFPGVFKGALGNKVSKITTSMKIEAAVKLASLVKKPSRHEILPSPFDKRVVGAVASAIRS